MKSGQNNLITSCDNGLFIAKLTQSVYTSASAPF
jgi:hypothetical protein